VGEVEGGGAVLAVTRTGLSSGGSGAQSDELVAQLDACEEGGKKGIGRRGWTTPKKKHSDKKTQKKKKVSCGI